MCHQCTPKMTPRKTSSPGNRRRRDVAGRRPSEALDTCLKDSCSIRNQVWMVHKHNIFLHVFLDCLLTNSFVSPTIPAVLFFAWLCFSSLNGSVLRIYLCANAAFHHTFSKRSRLCFVCFPLMHKLTHECFFLFAEYFCAFSSIYSFHNQALFVLIFMHVNNPTAAHFSRCFDSWTTSAYSASFHSEKQSE